MHRITQAAIILGGAAVLFLVLGGIIAIATYQEPTRITESIDRREELDLTGIETVVITTDSGTERHVRIRNGSHVEYTGTVERLDSIPPPRLAMQRHGNELRITIEKEVPEDNPARQYAPAIFVDDAYHETSSVTLSVPPGIAVRVYTPYGNIDASGVNATDARLETVMGDISVTDSRFRTLVTQSQHGSIELARIGGDITVQGSTIAANQITGDLHIAESQEATVADSALRALTCVNIWDTGITTVNTTATAVDCTVRGTSSITLDGRFGTTKLSARWGDIRAGLIEGPVTVDAYGDIDLSLLAPSGSVESHEGTITLRVPPEADLNVEARTWGGRVVSDVPLTIQTEDGVLIGRKGRADLLSVRGSGNGDVYIAALPRNATNSTR